MTDRGPRRVKRPSAFRFEVRRSGELIERCLTNELNQFFDLSTRGANFRGLRMLVLLLGICVLAFVVHMLLAENPFAPGSAPVALPALIGVGLISAARIALVLGIAILFGRQASEGFLADVFEIRDVGVAGEFIRRVAGGGGSEVLHLRDGKIADEDRDSPIALIGGPGYVVTDNDTAALFELPDGRPHVVGPSRARNTANTIALTGFERLREPVVSLRDQYIGSLGGAPLSVVSRSLDGMPISAIDVRGIYSIRRSPDAEAAEMPSDEPYPFDAQAVENLIYNQSVEVLTEGPHPSGQPSSWNSTMQDLIRAALADFMSHHALGEYVAGVGDKETELSEFREDTILSETIRLTSEATQTGTPNAQPKPKFHPRTELTARFLSENQEFASKALSHGLEMRWIGVGTWKMPDQGSDEAVTQKHLEAWQAHRQAAARAQPKALEAIAAGAMAEEKLRLVREVPLASHQKNLAKYVDKDVLVECLLQDYWEQMGDALTACYDKGALSPDQAILENAVAKLEKLLKIRQLGYLVDSGTTSRIKRRPVPNKSEAPPAPSTKAEADIYRTLLSKLGGDIRVAEGMINNEGRRHPGLTRQQLIEKILVRFERYGR